MLRWTPTVGPKPLSTSEVSKPSGRVERYLAVKRLRLLESRTAVGIVWHRTWYAARTLAERAFEVDRQYIDVIPAPVSVAPELASTHEVASLMGFAYAPQTTITRVRGDEVAALTPKRKKPRKKKRR